jgi:1-phosphofructokinase family hexose kinase
MIVSAGLSPAWQHTLEFDGLELGQVNRARAVTWCASGKVINAARAIHRLAAHAGRGSRGRALTVLGGPTGERMRDALAGEGLDVVAIPTAIPTRVCTTVIDRAAGSVTELVENAGSLSEADLEAFRARFRAEAREAAMVLLTGSLPAGTPPDYYRRLLEGLDTPALLDARGPELMAALPLKPFLVKPNREELARTIGHPLAEEGELCAAMRQLASLGARWVLVSQGQGPLWVLGGGVLHRVLPPAVTALNPIGSGDCLAGGIAWGLARGADPLEAIRIGVAAAAENARTSLPGHIDPESVERLRAAVRVEAA